LSKTISTKALTAAEPDPSWRSAWRSSWVMFIVLERGCIAENTRGELLAYE
jgi:hypothetical protein